MENVAVTGGLGFIGKHIVSELVNNGYKVKAIDIKGARLVLIQITDNLLRSSIWNRVYS